MLKSLISVSISICTALLVLLLIMPTLTQQPEADHVQSSIARLSNAAPVKATRQQLANAIGSITGARQSTDTIAQATEGANSAFSIENIVDATNEQRIHAGLAPLKVNAMLNASAKVKTDDMIAKQYFEHVSPSGKSVANLGKTAGYQYIVLGENLALGNFSDADDLLTAWMNSPGHKANILNPNYQDVGVYAAKATYQGREVWFAVQHFGTQRSACPGIDEAMRQSIAVESADLKEQEAAIATMREQIEGPSHPTGSEYQDLVTQFNALVKVYNQALSQSQQEIDEYNAQVQTFNACLSKYQKQKKA